MLMHAPHHIRSLWWEGNGQDGTLCLIDQTLLPEQTHYLKLHHEVEVVEAIRSLRVRGAPAIGVAAAFGIVLALSHLLHEQTSELSLTSARLHLNSVGCSLMNTRPTAVNLGWAVKRMLQCMDESTRHIASTQELLQRLYNEAFAIMQEDRDACRRMGEFGAALISEADNILTYCNTGVLATAGIGTALAPIYVAHSAGKKFHVFVSETRPVLQGARLTAWELQRARIPLTLITDNMAGYFMGQGHINAIFVGADCIAANGDTANKIGTYSLAVLAHVHNIPFYVVAPTSTIDLSFASGEHIPLEQRKSEEVISIRGTAITPSGVLAANPAFDVTPYHYITAIITEKGIVYVPYETPLRTIVDRNPSSVVSLDLPQG